MQVGKRSHARRARDRPFLTWWHHSRVLGDGYRSSTLESKKGSRIVRSSVASPRATTSLRQFSLRTLILLIVAFALVLAFVVLPAQSQHRSRQWVESQRGRVALTPNYRLKVAGTLHPDIVLCRKLS